MDKGHKLLLLETFWLAMSSVKKFFLMMLKMTILIGMSDKTAKQHRVSTFCWSLSYYPLSLSLLAAKALIYLTQKR
mgnify:CR=1 FL=1